MKSPYTGIKRILHAFMYSLSGLKFVFKNEAAFRQDLLLCVLGITLQFFIDVPVLHRIIMLSSLVLIILAELVNTAIETIVDRIGVEKNKLSGHAKDIGSAIVLITLLLVIALWVSLIVIV